MPIIAPGRRINPTIRRRSDIGRKGVYAGLFLTSMVDMFAIMVIFLLQSFSAEGELIVLPNGLELPKAQNVGTLERAPSLVISNEQVLFEGVEVAKTKEVAKQDDWGIPKLQDALKTYHAKAVQDAQKAAAAAAQKQAAGGALSDDQLEKVTQKINISADKRLTFDIVKKVIYNAGFAGYPDFRFAVFAGGKPDAPAAKK